LSLLINIEEIEGTIAALADVISRVCTMFDGNNNFVRYHQRTSLNKKQLSSFCFYFVYVSLPHTTIDMQYSSVKFQRLSSSRTICFSKRTNMLENIVLHMALKSKKQLLAFIIRLLAGWELSFKKTAV